MVLCFLVSAVPVQAASITTSEINAFEMLITGVLGPAIAYPLALDDDVWDTLVDDLMPALSSVEEQLRIIALSSTPILKPPTTQPNPAVVNNNYVANGYSQVIVFGDSMSDNGNMLTVSMNLANWSMPSSPNYGGRFCNGPVVLEIMSYILNRPLTDYAFVGALSGSNNLMPAYGFWIGMLTEVNDFISNLGFFKAADSKALYVIWTGPDDFYKGANIFDPTVASAVTANIKSTMVKLYLKGAQETSSFP